MSLRTLIAALLVLLATGKSVAQETVEVTGTVVDSLTTAPLQGVVVSVVASMSGEKMLNNFVTDKNGAFKLTYFLFPDMRLRLEFAHIAYQVRSVNIPNGRPKVDLGHILLPPDVKQIDQVVVRARLEMYRIKQDTTIFLPAAVKTRKGDPVIEVLRQMPGVEVSREGDVTIGGKLVERTYVNDRLIFGEDPRAALKYIEADKVSSILAYDELVEADTLRDGKHARKRKVLNVLTFDKFDASLNAAAKAAYGADTDRDPGGGLQDRYAVEGEANYFSEKRQITLYGRFGNARTDNGAGDYYSAVVSRGGQNDTGPAETYRRTTGAGIQYAGHTANGRHTYALRYDFTRTAERSESRSLDQYFPTDAFASRTLADTLRQRTRQDEHALGIDYNYGGGNFYAQFKVLPRFYDIASDSFSASQLVEDGASINASRQTTRSDMRSFSCFVSGVLRVSMGKKQTLTLNLMDNYSTRGPASSMREGTVTQTDTKIAVSTESSDRNISLHHTYSYNVWFTENTALELSVAPTYERGRTDTRAFDKITQTVDLTESRHATLYNEGVAAGAGIRFNHKKHRLDVRITYPYLQMKDDRTIPENQIYRRDFTAWLPSLNYRLECSAQRNFAFTYSATMQTPSTEQFLNYLDVTDPLFLRGGNPNLNRARTDLFTLNYSSMGREQSFSARLNFTYLSDNILLKRTIFTQAQDLPEYHYRVQPGATLATYTNGNGYLSLIGGVNWDKYVRALRSKLRFALSYMYSDPEECIGAAPSRTHRHMGEFRLSAASNFSRKIRLELDNTIAYSYYKSRPGMSDNIVREQFDVRLDWDIGKRLFLQGVYTFHHVSHSRWPSMNLDDHILNASFGFYLDEKRKGTLSFNVYDLLGSGQHYFTRITGDYIGTKWSKATARYFTFALSYKFNDTK